MRPLVLSFPVVTQDNRELLPAGTLLSERVVREVADAYSGERRLYPMMQHGNLKADVKEFIQMPPYDRVMAGPSAGAERVLALMDQLEQPGAVLEWMDYFKQADFYTYRHALAVYALSIRLAMELGPANGDVARQVAAGPSHDFGKCGVPPEVLQKSTPLTPRERQVLEHHSLAGYVALIYHFGEPDGMAARVARDHHERRNGSGYPAGIALSEPMVEVTAAVDVYDALLSPRPYRVQCYDNRTALEELTEMAKVGKFGWDVVRALVACNRKDKPDWRTLRVPSERRGKPPSDNSYGAYADESRTAQ